MYHRKQNSELKGGWAVHDPTLLKHSRRITVLIDLPLSFSSMVTFQSMHGRKSHQWLTSMMYNHYGHLTAPGFSAARLQKAGCHTRTKDTSPVVPPPPHTHPQHMAAGAGVNVPSSHGDQTRAAGRILPVWRTSPITQQRHRSRLMQGTEQRASYYSAAPTREFPETPSNAIVPRHSTNPLLVQCHRLP